MSVAPTVFLGMRVITTTPVYGDPDHPDRPTSLIQAPAWTPEDRGLLLGLEMWESGLCKCGQPRDLAWHSDMDGDFDLGRVLCHACTALNDGEKVTYPFVHTVRDFDARPLPPFRFGVTTTED